MGRGPERRAAGEGELFPLRLIREGSLTVYAGPPRKDERMKLRLHWDNGEYQDSIDLEGDKVEEIREAAKVNMEIRGWKIEHVWSEEIK